VSDPSSRLSPLHDVHVAAGATFTDFAGWRMPLRYGSELAEHHAVRGAAGLFDLSHMAEFRIEGAGAGAFLDFALAGVLSGGEVGRARYSLLLNDSGGVLDDVVVYRQADDRFLLVANAANRSVVGHALADRLAGLDLAGSAVVVRDVSDEIALIALQGPASRAILEATVGLGRPTRPFADLGYYRATDADFAGIPVYVGRTGYTGEDGFELYVAADAAPALWGAIAQAGADAGLVPAGLAARDTLRLEAGMPLYGHELSTDTLPAQVGLARVVVLDPGHDFVGRTGVEAGPAPGARILVGLASEGRRAGRAGYRVLTPDGREVGTVTSGALSPTLGHPIALAAVDPDVSAPGTALAIDVRDSPVAATVVPLPFYSRKQVQ
jgi:aminomethyltransferase